MKRRARAPRSDEPDSLFAIAKRRPVPFEFVLDELAALEPVTRSMFGATAVYIDEKIVFLLRDKGRDADDGVWVCTDFEHHVSLRRELPSLRSIEVFGTSGATRWQILPSDADDFEDSVLLACKLARARDPRLGRTPKPKRPRVSGTATKTPKPGAKPG